MFKRVLQTLDTVTERVSYIFIYISGFLAVVMACLATFGVIKRYVLNDPEPYTYEISTIFLLVGVIFAIPYVQQVRRNLMVDVIANNLANVNTTGFKRSQINFQDLLYVTAREPGTEV